jgi:hypothetical protein
MVSLWVDEFQGGHTAASLSHSWQPEHLTWFEMLPQAQL